MTERDDDQLELKKRARRRLVGAAAFATLAVVFLPMVMDEAPPPAGHEVQIKIPGQEPTGVAPLAGKPVASAAVQPNVTGAADKAATPVSAATAPSGADKSAPAAAGEPPKVEPSAKVVAVTRAAGAADSSKVATKAADKDASAKESGAKDVPAKETVAKETATKETATREGDGKRAQAILDGKSQSAPHVILIGAFANAANVKSLQAKLSELGVKTYTETLDSPQGKKTRLRAGPFPSRDAAEKAQGKMKRIGVNGVVAVKP